MAFGTGARQVIEGFAAQLGVPATPARDGSFSFVFAESGTLTLTSADDGTRTLVSLTRRPDRIDAALLRRALGRAGRDGSDAFMVHAGLTGDDSLLFAIGVDSRDLSLPLIETCLQTLLSHHRAVP